MGIAGLSPTSECGEFMLRGLQEKGIVYRETAETLDE